MREIDSIWPFQEVFVDPKIAVRSEKVNATLNLKTAVSVKREKEIATVTVEIFGSVTEGKRQIANIRFANVTIIENPIKSTKKLKQKIVEEKLTELISFLPDYLSKAGIIVESYEDEGGIFKNPARL